MDIDIAPTTPVPDPPANEIPLFSEPISEHAKDKWILFLILVLALFAAYLAFPAAIGPALGTECTILLRKDIFAASAPLVPTTDPSILSGTIRQLDQNGVVLETTGMKIWIPRENILLIRYNQAKSEQEY